MNLADARRYLDEHVNLEATAGRWEGLSLERMGRLVEVLGNPQHAYPVIHVTGTNGKGSVVRMVTELLRATGLSVGTYISPHLERLNERLAWDGQPIDDQALAEAIATVAAIEPLAEVTPSYFEILTAAAFAWFADLAVDVAVVEVGLLGRFDATNVADGQVAVLTNVGKDHTDGSPGWRPKIAEEKVGIVKLGSTFVLGETAEDLRPVFAAAPADEFVLRHRDFDADINRVALGGRLVDLRAPGIEVEDVFVPLHGAHQGDNAAIALAAAQAFFGQPLDGDLVRDAFAGVKAPGRFEVVRREPTVVLDCAHNVDGALAAAQTLAEEFTLAGTVILVVGLLEGRDPAEMLDALGAADAGFVVACAPPSPRAIPAPQVAAAAESLGAVTESAPSVVEAVRRALAVAGPEDLVLVAGSHYVGGEARSFLLADRDD